MVVFRNEHMLVDTQIAMAIPEGCYGWIAPRSGLAVRHGIDVGAGVIDSDYRGTIQVLLFNFGKEDFLIRKGDRIAQLIIERIVTVYAYVLPACLIFPSLSLFGLDPHPLCFVIVLTQSSSLIDD